MHFKAMPCHAGKALAAVQACLIFYEVGSALSEEERQRLYKHIKKHRIRDTPEMASLGVQTTHLPSTCCNLL